MIPAITMMSVRFESLKKAQMNKPIGKATQSVLAKVRNKAVKPKTTLKKIAFLLKILRRLNKKSKKKNAGKIQTLATER